MTNLFKIDSKGKLRILTVWSEDCEVRRLAGIYRGTLVATGKPCTGKNVGRANETTGEEQAILEAESEVSKKIREGYVRIDNHENYTNEELMAYINANSLPIPDCMLAKTYNAKRINWDEGMMVSPKLDGMRCMAVITESDVQLYSRGRKEITTMDHIKVQLRKLHKLTGFVGILDGELYYHDPSADNFQDIMKACKKFRPGVSTLVEYHVYELIDETLDAANRFNTYDPVIRAFNEVNESQIKIVPQITVITQEMADSLHSKFLADGYEGSMLKPLTLMYKQGSRSPDLHKRKDFQDAEYEVTDIVPMDAYPKQGKAACICHKTGHKFTATPKMGHSKREELLSNKEKYVGSTATITFFGFTDLGVPRIGVLKEFHFPEDLESFRLEQKSN